jgi:hypothetical protein
MTRTRRCVLLLVLTVAVVLGASLPANALFADSAAPTVKPAIGTATVAGPTGVKIDTSCTTTTTVIKRVYDTATNALLSSSQTATTASSSSNVESDTTVRTDDSPQVGQYTTTQTIKDTELFATLRWRASNSPGVTGYTMTAFLYGGAQTVDMGTAGPNDTSMTGQYDGSVMNYQAKLSMVTQTSYGWTAPGVLSNVVTCNL